MLNPFKPKIIAPIIGMIAFFTVTSCNVFGPDTSSALEKTEWQLEAFKDVPTPKNQEYRLTFVSESKFGGRSDCNEIGGNYKAFTDGRLWFNDII